MKLAATFFLALASSAAAAPAAPALFQLRTIVTAGNMNKNNLYVEGYHTGAGTADAVLVPNPPTNSAIFLNDTAIQFNYSATYSTWLNMASDVTYDAWNFVSINSITGPTNGFYFNNSASNVDGLGIGLKWNPNYPYSAPPNNATGLFAGWYACDWAHHVPQLFWVVRYSGSNNTLIDTCSKVELVRVAA